jgi:uncharacterized protein YbaR (Trm112 family)
MNDSLTELAEMLVCPVCHSDLYRGSSSFECTRCGEAFGLSDHVPRFLSGGDGDAKASSLARLHYAILGNPHVYDFQQKYCGAEPVLAKMRTELTEAVDITLLDVGAGTGVMASLVSPTTRYIWLDNDTNKLRGLLSKRSECMAVLGDAARLPFRDSAVDWTLMIEVSHHIDDDLLDACLAEAARVTRDRFLFVDAIRSERIRSKLMWNLDLGRFPRPQSTIVQALDRHFILERVENFRGVNHDHVLCAGASRTVERATAGSGTYAR